MLHILLSMVKRLFLRTRPRLLGAVPAGSASYTDFVEQSPLLSIAELAHRIGCEEWTLYRTLIDEAEAEGHHAVGYLVRSLLVRHLALPGKHLPIHTWSFEFAFVYIAGMLPRRYRPACLRVAFGFPRAEVDELWKPDNASDGVLVQLFSCYWDAPVRNDPALRIATQLHRPSRQRS